MITPRPYLSYSQLVLFEKSKEAYAEKYLFGGKERITRNMAYGSAMAEGLEHDESTGDPYLDAMMVQLPKYELMDKPLMAELKDGKTSIPLLAKPDSAKADYTAFYEYKTSVRPWTQRMADKSDQITFYSAVILLKTALLPIDIELVDVCLVYDTNSRLMPTGEIVRLPTKRTMVDILKMYTRIRKAWKGIKELCENQLI